MFQKIIITALVLGSFQMVKAQDANQKIKTNEPVTVELKEIYTVTDQRPTPGYDWMKYLAENINYPSKAQKNKVEGRVVIKFIVNEDGSISNVTVVKNQEIGNGIPEEAIRVIRNAPKWIPGQNEGKNVKSYMTVPMTFKLNS